MTKLINSVDKQGCGLAVEREDEQVVHASRGDAQRAGDLFGRGREAPAVDVDASDAAAAQRAGDLFGAVGHALRDPVGRAGKIGGYTVRYEVFTRRRNGPVRQTDSGVGGHGACLVKGDVRHQQDRQLVRSVGGRKRGVERCLAEIETAYLAVADN